jgi:hypothetical protein
MAGENAFRIIHKDKVVIAHALRVIRPAIPGSRRAVPNDHEPGLVVQVHAISEDTLVLKNSPRYAQCLYINLYKNTSPRHG